MPYLVEAGSGLDHVLHPERNDSVVMIKRRGRDSGFGDDRILTTANAGDQSDDDAFAAL
jgi:hypothetical protein